MNIHPTAVVSPEATLGHGVRIGAFCVVESDVILGDDCFLANHVVIKSGTTLGHNNLIFESAVLGGYPQHVNMPQRPGRVLIGNHNTLRESVTIHRALKEDETTVIGDRNLLMVNAHVGHDCRIGNNTVITNNAMLGGHVLVEDRAYVSGGVAVHQFCRIGSLAMVGGQARITRDVPPFVNIDGQTSLVVGLNQIGLRRAGFDEQTVKDLKAAYRLIYRSGLQWNEMLTQLRTTFADGMPAHFYEFLAATHRGIIPERRLPPGATLKLHREPEMQTPRIAKAG
ncbi:MAG: acyl-ACP--UDP-N-acetylglucosamine O-acyltransferase [Pirellulales bacterium]|nr:acyl-ACP--UDP-N-acetylglucosamine O-acyltransferase [Pirellulales bacterium]